MSTEYRPTRSQISIPVLQVPLGSRYIGMVKSKLERHGLTQERLSWSCEPAVSEYAASLKKRGSGSGQKLIYLDQRSTPPTIVSGTSKQLSKKHTREQGHFLDAFISAFDSVGEEDWKKLQRNASSQVDKAVYDDTR